MILVRGSSFTITVDSDPADGRAGTRWNAADGTKGGWIEIDLGAPAEFDGVRVEGDSLLGGRAGGAAALDAVIDRARVAMAAGMVGAADRALGMNEFQFGIQEGVTSVGFVIGSLAMAAIAGRLFEGQWLTIGYLGIGLIGILYSQSTSIPVAITQMIPVVNYLMLMC